MKTEAQMVEEIRNQILGKQKERVRTKLTLLGVMEQPTLAKGIHESVFRSYHMLELIECYLELGVNNLILLNMIKEIKALGSKRISIIDEEEKDEG